jgi:hypothetical protein
MQSPSDPFVTFCVAFSAGVLLLFLVMYLIAA